MDQGTTDWKDQARDLHAKGATVTELATYFGKSRSTISYALDLNGSRDKARERKRAERMGVSKRNPVARKPIVREPEPEPEVKAGPTLPTLSFLAKPFDADPVEPLIRRSAPKPIIVREAPGVDRWRTIHRDMKRRGKVPDRAATLIDQFHA